MKLRFSITLGFAIFCFQSLFSQSDFLPSLIVNRQNDTIYGIGNVSKNQEYCLFKKFDAKDFTKYYPNEISAFRIIDGKYYVSREIEESNGKLNWYFLEYLVDGEIDLFSISGAGRFFIKKENEEFVELNDNSKSIQNVDGKGYMVKNKKYLGYLRAYMSEAPELFPEIDEMNRLNQRDLVNISVDYHNAICDEYECVNYTKNIPKVTYYKFELVSGATKHNKYYSPQFGFLVHIWRPLKNEKLYFKAGIIYSDRLHTYKKDINKEGEYDYSIKFPVSFQYVFGKGDFKPTIAFGWPTGNFLLSSFQSGFIYSLSDKYELSVNASIDGLLSLTLGMHKSMFNSQLGHSLNIGLIYDL